MGMRDRVFAIQRSQRLWGERHGARTPASCRWMVGKTISWGGSFSGVMRSCWKIKDTSTHVWTCTPLYPSLHPPNRARFSRRQLRAPISSPFHHISCQKCQTHRPRNIYQRPERKPPVCPEREKKKQGVPGDIAPNGEADIWNERGHLYLLLQGSQ